MPELEHKIRVEYKYTALTKFQFIKIQHELTLIPKSEIQKVIEDKDYVIQNFTEPPKELPKTKEEYSDHIEVTDELIADLQNSNMSIDDISEKYKVTKYRIYNTGCYLKRKGYDIPNRRNVSDKAIIQVRELRAKGCTLNEISEITGHHITNVGKYLKRKLSTEKEDG